MARTVPLQQGYLGMRQDDERGRLPRGSVWNMVDVIPEIDDAPGGKRGGWAWGSNDISLVKATAATVQALVYAGFSAGARLVAIDEDGELYTVDTATLVVTDRGAAVTPKQRPVLHAEKLIIPAGDGTTAPKYYDGATTVAALAGSPPAGKWAEVYKDRTCLAYTSAFKTRVFFSGAADPTTWDTTNTWQSVQAPITGLAALPNALLVFQEKQTSRIRGYNPPPNGDFIVDDPLFKIGCTDARSIAVDGATCVFANPRGIYLTDGTLKPEDLTASVGLKRYWTNLLALYNAPSWILAGGIIKNYYVISVMNGAFIVDTLMIDLPRRRAIRLGNVHATMLAEAVTVGEELYFGLFNAPRIGKLSTIFSPSDATKNDADGSPVQPVIETGFFRDRGGFKRWLGFYVGYDMRDEVTDNPTLAVSYITNPEDAYTAFAATLIETTNYSRQLIREPQRGEGIAFKLAQTHASAHTRFYDIEAEVYAEEQSKTA